MESRGWFWRGVAVLVALATGGAVVAVINTDGHWLWILSWLGLSWHATLAAALLTLPAGRWWGRLRGVLLVLLLLVSVVWVAGGAFDFSWSEAEDFIYTAAALTHMTACAVILLGLLRASASATGLIRLLRRAIATSIGALVLCWSLIALEANFTFDFVPDETLEDAVGVLTLLMSGGVFCVVALELQLRREISAQNPFASAVLKSACPRCGRAQDFVNGHGACAHCGLRVWLDIHEPRCACGYLLYDLPSDTCPECGRKSHPDAQRPTAPAAVS